MMIKRIDLFTPPNGQHQMLQHFTNKLYEAFIRLGVNCRLLEAEKQNPLPFLMQIFDDKPDCTLSLNGLLPDAEGRFFCDMLNIPHVALLVNSPHHFFPLANSSYNIIACTDSAACDMFRGMGHDNTLFLPHGIEPNIAATLEGDKPYDLLFLEGLIGYDSIEKKWHKKFPKSVYNALMEAAEAVLFESDRFYIQELGERLYNLGEGVSLKTAEINFSILLDELENYLQAKNTCLVAKALKGHSLHVLGNETTRSHWEEALAIEDGSITVHHKSSFYEILEMMKLAKIVVNTAPEVKNGSNDYLFAAMSSGSIVATNENQYVRTHFKKNQEIVSYKMGELPALRTSIDALLANQALRLEMASQGRERAIHHDSWDHRAATLLKELNLMITK